MITLNSIVAYKDEATDKYYERICIGFMQGRAIPASLEEVGPLDPGCAGCGVHVLSQVELDVYRQLIQVRQEA